MTFPRFSWRAPTAAFAAAVLASVTFAQDPPPPPVPAGGSPEGVVELTRGPIHEAFGQPTVFNPQPGPTIAKAPPEAIEELPPDQKPEGDHVAWIPGYWHWDDEEKTFLWVSGFWRAVPHGRTWMPGYWTEVDGGYQWVSGFWADAQAEELTYLPPPPESLEVGPPAEATAEGQIWVPGSWIWRETRYVWRPGFWAVGNPDWVWVPAQYVWTPNGFVFIEGYWDYPMFDRGLLFAPVALADVRPGFVYRPAVVLDPRVLVASLFARPVYSHYYFGDYYAETYVRSGIYPWFAFHNSRFGYDPLFAHTNFVYSRRDADWASQVRESFFYRREHEAARPPRTYRAYSDWARRQQGEDAQTIALAQPLTQVARNREFPARLGRVDDREAAAVRTQAARVRQFRDQRVKLEQQAAADLPRAGTTADPKAPRRSGRTAPARVRLPEAPKLGPAGTTGKTRAPGTGTGIGTGRDAGTGTGAGTRTAPPEAPRAPAVDPEGPPAPTAKERTRTLPDPEDLLRRDPSTGRPLPKGAVPPTRPRDPVLTPPNRPDLPGRKGPPARDDDPPIRKDRPGIDPPGRLDPPAKKGGSPPVTLPPMREPPPTTLPPRKDPPPTVTPPTRPTPPKSEAPPPKSQPPAAPPKREPPPKKGGKDKDRDGG